MKKILAGLLTATLFTLGAASLSAADTAPKSVIHVVTLKFKDDAKPEQIQAALDGVKAMPAGFPGITRVWVKSFKVQNAPGTTLQRTHAFVMEFKDEQALKDYGDSPAQLEWYKLYTPIRVQSTTHDITN